MLSLNPFYRPLGGIIPPHMHPVGEQITVVQGTLYFAVGDRFDRSAMQEIKAGGYAFIPKGSTMFGYTPDAAIVQVHRVGPFRIHWRDGYKTLDSPDGWYGLQVQGGGEGRYRAGEGTHPPGLRHRGRGRL